MGIGVVTLQVHLNAATTTNGVPGIPAPTVIAQPAEALVPSATDGLIGLQVESGSGPGTNLVDNSIIPAPVPELELVDGGAATTRGLVSIRFAADVNDAQGTIQLTLPNGTEWPCLNPST